MTDESSTTILACFDGSDRAVHAIETAARLFPGASVHVLHVWEPFEHIAARHPGLYGYVGDAPERVDRTAAAESARITAEGAAIAERWGLRPREHSVRLARSLRETVQAVADDVRPDAIITGTRGLRGVHELVAGSLSHRLMQRSVVPVLAIPLPRRAAARVA